MAEHLKKVCPLTKGKETSMSRTGFERACQSWKKEVSDADEGSRRWIEFNLYLCLECKGPPPELVFVELSDFQKINHEEKIMATEKNKGKCECCEQVKNVSKSYGKLVCSMCMNLRANIKKRPDVVIRSIVELSPESLPDDEEYTDLVLKLKQLKTENQKLSSQVEDLSKQKENFENYLGFDRSQLQDLALRIAVGLITEEQIVTTVEDVEMLRAI